MIFQPKEMFEYCKEIVLFKFKLKNLSLGERVTTITFYPFGYLIAILGLIVFWIAARRDEM